MADDTDSDWDSSVLDFSTTPRGPRTVGFNQQPPKEMDAIEEASETSTGESRFLKTNVKQTKSGNRSHQTGTSVAKAEERNIHLQRKNSTRHGPALLKESPSQPHKDGSPKPPYNFRGLYDSGALDQDKHYKIPGKDKKGNRYDPKDINHDETSIQSEEEDADEIILRQVRENFNKERGKSSAKISKTSHKITNDSKFKCEDSDMEFGKTREPNLVTHDSSKKEYSLMAHERQKNFPVLGDSKVFGDDKEQAKMDLPQNRTILNQVITHNGKEGIRYVYHFDQGNMTDFMVEDARSSLVMPGIANKVEKTGRRIIQELFGCLKIGLVCIVLFMLEVLTFVCRDLLGPLVFGTMSTIGDHLLKPAFSGLYNCAINPVLVLLWNILSGLRHALVPCFDITRELTGQITTILKGVRLVEINQISRQSIPSSQSCISHVDII